MRSGTFPRKITAAALFGLLFPFLFASSTLSLGNVRLIGKRREWKKRKKILVASLFDRLIHC